MPETKIPTGISANKHNCWELIDPANGLPVDDHGDGIRHYDSRADALSWSDDSEASASKRAGLYAREMAEPCWIAMAACGWTLDDELPMVMHHVNADEALRAALDNDMRIDPDGALTCGPDCDDCHPDRSVTGS